MYAIRRPISFDSVSPPQLWTALIAVSVADIVTTIIGLRAGAPEGNPVVAAAISSHGLWTLVPLKLLMLAVWKAGFSVLPYRWEIGFLVAGTAFFGVIVLVNVGMIGVYMGLW